MPASKIHIINAAKKAIPAGKTREFPMKIQFFSKTCALQPLVKQANPR
jgi:hypothetical protein